MRIFPGYEKLECNGYDGWSGTFSVTGGEGVVNVKNTGTVDYGVQFYQDGVKLYKGNKYSFHSVIKQVKPVTDRYVYSKTAEPI
jgi:hypothetical protein